MDAAARKKMQSRAKRIAGQVAGVQRMLDADRYCVDVLHQIAAIRSALDALGVELLSKHLESCVLGHGEVTAHDCAKPLTKEQLLEEVRHALTHFLR
jgi:DNA-binding FrmR family transcriptional regulator